MSAAIAGVWFKRMQLGPFVGGVIVRGDVASRIDQAALAARITDYGITPEQCEPARVKGDRVVIIVRGPVGSTTAELQDLLAAKLAGDE